MENNTLTAIIDFGCTGFGDPACDLMIAYNFFTGSARDIFMYEMNLDTDTWMRAKGWTFWKATYELNRLSPKDSPEALIYQKIIRELLKD